MGVVVKPNTSPNQSVDRLRADQLVAVGALSLGALLLVGPWLFTSLLVATGVVCGRWWAKKGRFNGIKPAESKFFLDTRDWKDLEIEGRTLMYLGTTEENTIRWWFDGYDRVFPQAIDDGTIYWDKYVEVTNQTLLRHLKGFYEMGNEWPEYYKTVVVPREKKDKEVTSKKKRKNKSGKTMVVCRDGYAEEIPVVLTYHGVPCEGMVKHPTSFTPEIIKAVESDLPRADYTDAQPETKPATAAMAADAPLMELIKTVKDLEKDATGSCPTIDFKGIST